MALAALLPATVNDSPCRMVILKGVVSKSPLSFLPANGITATSLPPVTVVPATSISTVLLFVLILFHTGVPPNVVFFMTLTLPRLFAALASIDAEKCSKNISIKFNTPA